MRRETEAIVDAALRFGGSIEGSGSGRDPKGLPASSIEADQSAPIESNVIQSFGRLADLAVLRPTLYQRKGVFFVGCRQWFAPAKLAGINTLKAAKDSNDPEIRSLIVDDLETVARLVFEPFEGIVTAPSARHSAFAGLPHFASHIAEDLAGRLGQKYELLFEPTAANRKGHHPAREKDLPIVIEKRLPMASRILLVDELATSGQTLEWHAKALREKGAKVSILVWCYGATSGTGRS